MPRRTQATQRHDGEDGISPSSSKKCKSSTPTPDIVLIEKAPLGFDQDLLRCPICTQFPRREVYQCNTGHSVCANCILKLRSCPTCKGLFKKVRNYLAEGLLDSMKFQCSWKDLGCAVAPLARKDLTSHEAQCKFNPNCVKFCSMFLDKGCTKKFCPISTQDPAEINVFLDHMKSAHDFAVQDVNPREPFLIKINLGQNYSAVWPVNVALLLSSQRQLFKTVFRLHSARTSQNLGNHQFFVILSRFEYINGQTSLLIKCIRLTDENEGTMSLSFSLKPGLQENRPQLPELCWNVKPQGIRKLKDFFQDRYLYLGTPADDLSSYHMISDAFLRNCITGGETTIECVFS